MRKFLYEVIVKGSAVIFVCSILSCFLYSLNYNFYDSFELPEIIRRQQHFKINNQDINTVFIGSSRIFRHIDPILFDSLTGLKSYNLGYAGLFPFRSYDYIESLDLTNAPAIKNVFIELSPIALLGQNFNTDPFIYSINPSRYSILLSFVLEGSYDLRIRFKYLSGYSLLMAYKYLGIGSSKFINHLLYGNFDIRINSDANNNYKKGYLSLDDDLASQGEIHENLLTRRSEFLDNPDRDLKKYSIAYDHYKPTEIKVVKDQYSTYVKSEAKKLIKKGFKVFFIICPRQEYDDLLYLKGQKKILKEFKVYDFSDPKKYSELFNEKYSFDRVHLNKNGAEVFTQKISKEVVKEFNK